MSLIAYCFALLSLLTLQGLAATTYHVSLEGDDAHDGRSPTHAFRTIQRGVDALAEGDTLTIAPGEYREAVAREGLGGPDRDTVIRAKIPGTVVLRGDRPVDGFDPVPDQAFVHALEVGQDVQAVLDLSTPHVLRRVPVPTELPFRPGTSYQCPESKRLLIATSDLQPPDRHAYAIAVLPAHGLLLSAPERVVVEGLVVRGFHSTARGPHFPGYQKTWGILLAEPRHCVIRDCAAFLNGAGIAMHLRGDASQGNRIERSRAWNNVSGGIIIHGADGDEIRDSQAWRNGYVGIGFYGQNITGPAMLRHNLAWGNTLADLRIKGGPGERVGEHCIALGNADLSALRHTLIGVENAYAARPERDTILFPLEEDLDPGAEFADPRNLDFRLQPDSRFRNAAPDGSDRGPFPYRADIFYLHPDGDDAADGLSMARPWRTLARALPALRPGDTLYLAGGVYDAPDTALEGLAGGETGIAVLGRGLDAVTIRGALQLTDVANLRFERVDFAGGGVRVETGADLGFRNCRFFEDGGLDAQQVRGLRLTQSVFSNLDGPALRVRDGASVFLRGNVFDNRDGPAVHADRLDAFVYSDYNSYRDLDRAWRFGDDASGEVVPDALPVMQWLRETGHERYARALPMSVTVETGRISRSDAAMLADRGPLGRAPGVHRDFRAPALRLEGPVVHAVEDTVANLEWTSSGPVVCEIAWGRSPDALEGHKTLRAEGFTSFSLEGLEPDSDYVFVLRDAQPESEIPGLETRIVFASEPVAFRTLEAPPTPVVYHVAPDGDDANSGLGRDQAWRTVGHAAARVRSGDTVKIAGGTYAETVRVRATGREGRPVTFRAAPGERVEFDGRDRGLNSAFILTWKHHVHADGFYFRMYGDGGWIGIFDLYRSHDAQLTRCLLNGIGPGYTPRFVNALHSARLSVRNCVIAGAFDGFVVRGCPELTLEHNVFLRNWIQAMIVNNNPEQSVTLRNNIITDNLPDKVRAGLLEFARVESLIEANNGYWLRVPEAERRLFCFYGDFEYERALAGYNVPIVYPAQSLITELTYLSLPDFQERFAPDSGSIVMDPRFRVIEGQTLPEAAFPPDELARKRDLDFSDLFATHPEFVERGIGLQPEAFADFHFNR